MRSVFLKKGGFIPRLLRINYRLFRRRQSLKGAGFTVVEMMVTLGIITLLTIMVLVYSRQGEKVTNLMRDSDIMVYELRRAQNLAMLTLQQDIALANPICGWGIYLNGETQYLLFSDFCNLGVIRQYDPGEETETLNLLKGVQITETNISSVTFVPPEPKTKFQPALLEGESAFIKLCLEAESDEPETCSIIYVSPAGQIKQ